MVTFKGLEPWYDNSLKIEFESLDGRFDLHNNAVLNEVRILVGGATLVLRFSYADDWREIETAGRPVELEFDRVTELRIEQADDFDPRAANTLEGVVHEVDGDRSRFTVDLGDFTATMAAESVSLRVWKGTA